MSKTNGDALSDFDVKEHPYYKLMTTQLNATECYVIMLWKGNKLIENLIIPSLTISREEYFNMRKDFKKKFPGFMKKICKEKPTDCCIC